MLRIKLVKIGKKDRPTWRVVVVEKTKTGRGRVTEYIGNYNPHLKPREFKIDQERYDHWVGVGAQPTDSVLRLKGKHIDKSKDYQKIVKTKVYKKKTKKGEEAKPKPDQAKTEQPVIDKAEQGQEAESEQTAVEEPKVEEAKEETQEEEPKPASKSKEDKE